MKYIKTILLLLLSLSNNILNAADKDSLRIADIKRFIYKQFGTDLNSNLYTKYDEENKPIRLIYVSLADKVKVAPGLGDDVSYVPNGIYVRDENAAQNKINRYEAMGYHTFYYKTFGCGNCDLTERFLSYPDEAKSFILYHELTHNFIFHEHLKIPYEFNEALADVMGNYGTLEYAGNTLNIDISLAKRQIELNENIYRYLNLYIDKINKHPRKAVKLDSRCEKKIKPLINKGNLYQKDRFDYKVNNAYLLKNQNYSKYYFLIKKVYLKQGTIRKLLEIMKAAPENSDDIEKYLQKFI